MYLSPEITECPNCGCRRIKHVVDPTNASFQCYQRGCGWQWTDRSLSEKLLGINPKEQHANT